MSHYCCKRCGQRYEHCVCPDVQPTSPVVKTEEPAYNEPIWEDELATHHTLGELRMHIDFLIAAYGEDTVVVFDAGANNISVEIVPDPDHEG